ncbi:hypothetical protein MUN53_08400 [Parabacteroides sp. AGMB00274]|uniref:Major fimbrial subunit protein N-terminal domain-containing protein n=1 Tax=Parabacteroides faecalis TaxID=2924040 RepID=A0ABT0C189_9BACT|nr:hypothetical protein [Parabacteroides faecalis]MCI7285389.1 hypothetical protein [Parabacteroides sp.]MCJ2380628.1 hypothetical protein [Parabacteroides faecalis]
MNRLKDTYKHMAAVASALLLALSVLPACSDDEGGGPGEEEGKLYTVTLSLNPSARGAVTKANPDWATDTEDAELGAFERHIKDCVVAIFRDNAFVSSLSAGIQNVKEDITLDNSGTEHANNATKVGEATVELPAGNYTFYAFANLSSLDKITTGGTNAGTDLINKILTGDNGTLTPSALEALTVSLGDDPNLYNPEDEVYIPMSSYGETKVLESDDQMDITLFRMLGKVTLTIDNQTQGDLELSGITMGNFRRGDIFLVPYKSGNITLNDLTQNEESYQPKLPDETNNAKTHELKYEEAKTITAGQKSERFTFYEFETRSEQQGSNPVMKLTMNIVGKDDSEKDLGFSFMRRNDWLDIPVMVLPTDLTMSFKELNMPIGGTPSEITYNAQEPFVPAIQYSISKAGELRIDFTLGITGFNNIKLEYEPTTPHEVEQYTEAFLTENTNDLLYDATTQDGLAPRSELTINSTGDNSGNIVITSQELAYLGTATIELTLVATYTNAGDGTGRVIIPYTIILTNGKPAK